jgi:integrase/recombinase XerC/integrase/recombinase XerD
LTRRPTSSFSLGGSPRSARGSAGWSRAAPHPRPSAPTSPTSRSSPSGRGGHDLAPEDLDHKRLRQFAGVLSERGASKSTVARKLASARSFYRHLVDRGELEASPADLVTSPKRDQYLPRVLKEDDVASLLDSIPASTPLELRDRAIFELAYATGLRAEELTALDTGDADFDAEELRSAREGRQGARRPIGEQAWRTSTRTWSAAGHC